jgi:hypothetical protein
MAKQKGHIKYVGTLGEVRHFKIKGNQGYFAGLKGGATGEQIKTAENFVRTRENMSEFAGCALAGKYLRTGLSSLMKQMSDSQLTGRLTGIMKKINLEDGTETRGQRAILITDQPQYLIGLDFDKNISFRGVFAAPYTLTANTDRNETTLTVPAFNPMNLVSVPSGATHFRLVNAVSVLSNVVFNADTGSYEAIDNALNNLNKVEYSGYLPIDSVTSALTVVSTLDGSPTMSTDVAVIGSVGIEFYQEVSGNFYLFASGNALRIQDIF